MTQSNVRNFCIIAHVDHGKSTLADRLLEITGTIHKRDMVAQFLDSSEISRERGITIKLQPVRMEYQGYVLNLIDTPGHVDFSYEVSRSLAACEGAVLLVDATQGVQAQTIANMYLALEQNLTIIPVINKIDLPAAQVEKCEEEFIRLLGCKREDILRISGKTGMGVPELIQEIIKRIPAPKKPEVEPLRALIFDSKFDEYRGVIAYVRLFSGQIKKEQKFRLIATKEEVPALEVGYFKPKMLPADELVWGDIGYVVTGLHDVNACQVGDTLADPQVTEALPGYRQMKPMVFAGVFCKQGDDYPKLRDAIAKLKLNDSALQYEPEHSPVLGYGFRCGYLGMLHMEVFQQRLLREFGLEVVSTVPSVAYKVQVKPGLKEVVKETTPGTFKKISITDGIVIIKSPHDLPEPSQIEEISEPFVNASVIVPSEYIGNVMKLMTEKRGEYINTEFLNSYEGSQGRALLHYQLPLSSILVDFYDKLKSVTAGYASLNYEISDYRAVDVVRLDILVALNMVDALASMVYRDEAYQKGRKIVESLKKVLPRQQFEVKIQASINNKVIASERIAPFRKDVADLSGGDVSRKRKLLEKQKAGKKRMRSTGSVDIPSEAYLAVLRAE